MSGYKKHILGYLLLVGLLSGLLFYFHLVEFNKNKLEIFIPALIIGLFYSLLPDIDTPKSKLRALISKLFLATILCCLLAYVFFIQDIKLLFISLALTFFLYILWFSKHRKIFHSPFTGVFLALPLYLINPYFFSFALIGFLTHLIIDGELLR
jgi:hypothetical protein